LQRQQRGAAIEQTFSFAGNGIYEERKQSQADLAEATQCLKS
jgi:hypothetical protein